MKDFLEFIVRLVAGGPILLVGVILQYIGWCITIPSRMFWQGLRNGWKGDNIFKN